MLQHRPINKSEAPSLSSYYHPTKRFKSKDGVEGAGPPMPAAFAKQQGNLESLAKAQAKKKELLAAGLMPTRGHSLTWKEKRFVAEYLSDPGRNATHAAKRAGYSKNTTASNIFYNPMVQQTIDEHDAKLFAKLDITKEKVLFHLGQIAFANMFDFCIQKENGDIEVDLTKIPREKAVAISELAIDLPTPQTNNGEGAIAFTPGKVRIKLADKLTALQLLGKHVKLWDANKSSNGEVTINFIDRIVSNVNEELMQRHSSKVIEVHPE